MTQRQPGFRCRRCGHCCLALRAHDTECEPEDVARWLAEGRRDILARVQTVASGGTGPVRRMWYTVEGERRVVDACPWLEIRDGAYSCAIESTKAAICRDFPLDAHHARSCGCPGYDDLPDSDR